MGLVAGGRSGRVRREAKLLAGAGDGGRARLARGGVLLMVLVFVSMFAVIFIGLSGFIGRSYHEAVLQSQDELAFQVAEAGLNFARWRLAHEPDEFEAESRAVTDQFAGQLGTFTVTFAVPQPGSTVVEITSRGRTSAQPAREVTLRARYGQPSLARYASITNNDVWYGGQISGPVHANGGIRMDGQSDSLMTSAQETYACQPYHGCRAPFETKPGVWGSGEIQSLWDFPVPVVDYNALTLDLLAMRDAAQAAGTYLAPSRAFGYEVVFNSNNTYAVYRVTSLGPRVWSWWEGVWERLSHDVGSRQLLATRAVPSNGVIYAEDTVWVRGDVRDRVTVAAGVFPDSPATNVNIILNGSLGYGGVTDGSRAFAAVAQRHVLLPWSGVPDVMQLDGAFVAQRGSFHRRYYPDCCGAQAHRLKTSLMRYGMIASNGVPATAWVDGSGRVISGFRSGQSAYDPYLRYGPPPYFPTSGQYEFISWEEDQ